jgi:hypothetical protein
MRVVADATLEGSEKLVAWLKEINDTSKELKKEELALEIRIHEENLRYKQEKDKVLLENSKLALLNQSAVVATMASLVDTIRSVKAPTGCTIGSNAEDGTQNGTADAPCPARTTAAGESP